ncbi:Uncharacterised protein [Escherichia coli]|uniref:TET-Associated Glycosyltransferase domain-containing protein n=1 Tax=Escherichia coli TaxID=562 RepID=A0A376MW80_ECOLX|nr:Uncharacterised protein [Escherichia coli]
MRDDFCAFILTHGRPDKVLTYRTLRRAGYTGKIFIVVDDEDKTRHQYMAEFGEQVLVFSKADIASRFDEADNLVTAAQFFTPVMPVSTRQNWSGVNTSFSSMMIITSSSFGWIATMTRPISR